MTTGITIDLGLSDIQYVNEFGKMYESSAIIANLDDIATEKMLKKHFVLYTSNYDSKMEWYEKRYIDRERKILVVQTKRDDLQIYFASNQFKYVKKLVSKMPQSVLEFERGARINLLCSSGSGFYLKGTSLESDISELDLNYGQGFAKFHNDITEKLNHKSVGVVLLHGLPGSGKTSYIKHLTKCSRRRFVIIPNYMIESLSSPNMIPFLIDNEELVLVLEDAESAIMSREDGSRGPVGELLNLSDGLIGAAIKCSLIITFNTDVARIDAAFLRKGRLIGEHKFGKLSVDDSNNLLAYLGKNYKATEPMLLADIYNIDKQLIKTKAPVKNEIGFHQKN